MRPVVGVTGDLYTRINPAGNAGLFERRPRVGSEPRAELRSQAVFEP